MSMTHPSGGGFGGPPAGYPYQADSNRPKPPPPTLPSMSSLLNPEPIKQEPQYNQLVARQFHPPNSVANQMHPVYQNQRDPIAPVQPYHPHSPPAIPQSSQFQQPMKMYEESQYPSTTMQSGEAPSARGDQDFQSEYPQRYYPAQTSRSPSQGSFEPEIVSSRRQSTFSEALSRGTPQVQNSKMPISNLLSEQPRPAINRPSPKYSLTMRQQPVAARACGFGERDRRVIDPPPILQMHVSAPHLTAPEIRSLITSAYTVIHCILWDSENNCDASAMPGTTDKRQQRRLMGTLVASPFVGKDENNEEGCFFTFPDLSVRTPGKYSLKFSLVSLDPKDMGPGSVVFVKSVIISDDFQVFNAKDFGGMRASTALTKTLKLQGCLISVKKGNTKNSRGEDDDDEEDDDDDEGRSSMKRGKRSKR
ncbi:hypothetical protein VTL71DRAFT_3859 [Oculimacula yallundae]|uniref:Velvet domain-containing protein n=1 Tax=Oculimacula yallundae TaxID=86028 RepID=A0ABR4C463_9HELO